MALSDLVASVGRLFRSDAIYSASTGLGRAGSKGSDYVVEPDAILNYDTLKAIFRTNPYVRRAVVLPVSDALSKGFHVRERDLPVEVYERSEWSEVERDLRMREVALRARVWARAFGTSYVVPVLVERGNPPLDEPLDPRRVEKLLGYLVWTPRQLRPDRWPVAYLPGPDLQPVYYRASVTAWTPAEESALPLRWWRWVSSGSRLHHSRVIRVLGEALPSEDALTHPAAEADALTQVIFRTIARAEGVDAAAAFLATEIKQDVITNPALEAVATSDQAEAFFERMRQIATGKSLARVILLGRDERYDSSTTQLTGFKDLAATTRDAVTIATGIPESVFYARAAAGGLQGATGHGPDTDAYLAYLRAERVDHSTPLIEAMARFVTYAKGPLQGVEDFEVVYPPLREESPKDLDSRRLVVMQAASIAAGAGIVPPEYFEQHFQAPDGWTFDIPAYDPEKYPRPPPEVEGGPSGGAPPTPGSESPNAAGKNAPGQMPPDPTKLPTPSTGAAGADVGNPVNTGARGDAETYKPPPSAAGNAKKALKWKEEHPSEIQGMTSVGWATARRLASGRELTLKEVKKIAGFARHRENYKKARAKNPEKPWTEPAIVAWLGWGGTSAIEWAAAISKRNP